VLARVLRVSKIHAVEKKPREAVLSAYCRRLFTMASRWCAVSPVGEFALAAAAISPSRILCWFAHAAAL
jgi:hypothetical protein